MLLWIQKKHKKHSLMIDNDEEADIKLNEIDDSLLDVPDESEIWLTKYKKLKFNFGNIFLFIISFVMTKRTAPRAISGNWSEWSVCAACGRCMKT